MTYLSPSFPRAFALLLAVLGASACGDDPPRYERSCAHNCDRAHECSASIDIDACERDCQARFARIGPHLRGDYLDRVDGCVDDRSCTGLALDIVLNTCPNEARARVAPSESAVDFCESISTSVAECVGPRLGTALCIDNVKIFNDATLASAARCSKVSCDERLPCLEDVFGQDPTATLP